jgi:bla regulator protein blaR1
MERIDEAVATFLINSAWQVTLVAGLAWILIAPIRSAALRHRLWAFSLVLSLILPLASVVSQRDGGRLSIVDSGTTGRDQSTVLTALGEQGARAAEGHEKSIVLHLPGRLCFLLTAAYGLFLVWRLAVAFRAWRATCRIRSAASRIMLSGESGQIAEQCRAAFGLRAAVIASSARVRVPAAIGSRSPIITLPEGLLAEFSIDEWTAVLGHEMAHIQRHDFGRNLCYEFLSLPLSFHPAAAFVKRRIAISREQACDDLVVSRLMPPLAYARSLVKVAGLISEDRELSWALASCERRGLEGRIDRLLSASGHRTTAAGWAWAAAGMLVVCSVVGHASAFRIDPTVVRSPERSIVTPREAGLPTVPASADSFREAEPRHGRTVRPEDLSDGIHAGRFHKTAPGLSTGRSAAPPSDGRESDLARGEINDQVANNDPSPQRDSGPAVPLLDDKLVRPAIINLAPALQPGSLEAAARAAMREAVAKGQAMSSPSPNLDEPFRGVIPTVKNVIPVMKTRKRLITWLAIGAAGGFTLSQLDFEHEDEGHKERR